jgi:Zn-dependent protease
MRELTSWSVSIGSWSGILVRIHVLLALVSIWALYLCRPVSGDPGMIGHGALCVVILWASILANELVRIQTVLRLGGKVEEIVLGPFGSWEPIESLPDARRELFAALAGPAANLAVMLLAGVLLAAVGGVNPLTMLHPLEPAKLLDGAWPLVGLKLVFWINWLLVLLNILPAAPFAGGRVLRAAVALQSPDSGPDSAAVVVALLGRAAAIVLAIIACAVYAMDQDLPAPPWFALGLLSILLFFSARQEDEATLARRREWALRNYELPDPGADEDGKIYREDEEELDVIARWREQRQEAKVRRQSELEADEERRVDEILARLHAGGLESLSPEDRAVLERVSARYRSRQRSS